jgi:hypothetical protein
VRARLQPAEVVARSAGGVRARERVAVRFEQAHRGSHALRRRCMRFKLAKIR